jgi:peptide-methionine (S)-S-oxide reductase
MTRPKRSSKTLSLIRSGVALTALLGAVGLVAIATPLRAEKAVAVPSPVVDEASKQESSATAVFAGGCFWGVQGVFQHVKGVTSAVSGYAGGDKATAHYQLVGSGTTGHAESVRVTYDPRQISYGQLLQVYFSVAHDGTELNRQGPDIGKQYRSAIFPINAEQAKIAEAYIAQLNGARVFNAPLVTTIEPGKSFYPAEGYHQDFLARNPTYPYIAINDLPKIANLKRLLPELYRGDPVLVRSAQPSN